MAEPNYITPEGARTDCTIQFLTKRLDAAQVITEPPREGQIFFGALESRAKTVTGAILGSSGKTWSTQTRGESAGGRRSGGLC